MEGVLAKVEQRWRTFLSYLISHDYDRLKLFAALLGLLQSYSPMKICRKNGNLPPPIELRCARQAHASSHALRANVRLGPVDFWLMINLDDAQVQRSI
jgi:hypothetical protein